MGSSSVSLDELDQQSSQSANSVSLDELDAQSPALSKSQADAELTRNPLGPGSPGYKAKPAPTQSSKFTDVWFPNGVSTEAQAGAARAASPKAAAEAAAGMPLADVAGKPHDPQLDVPTEYNPKTGMPFKSSLVPDLDAPGFVPGAAVPRLVERTASGLQDMGEAFTPQVNEKTGAYERTPAGDEAKKRQMYQGASDVISGAGGIGMQVAPIAVMNKPVSTIAAMGFGLAASEGAGAIAHRVGASPEAEELTRNVGFFLPSLMGVASGLKTGTAETPAGKFSGASAFGGKVRAGIARTPDVTSGRVKVGDTQFEVNIPRNRPAPVPEPSEAAKALASFEQHTGNPGFQPAPPPPVPPGTNGPEHLTPDVVKGVSDAIMQADPVKRPGLMTEAHGNMVKWMVGRGTFVGPDSKIHTVDSEGQAKKLASKFINDEVDRRDAEADKAAKAAEEAPKAQAAAVSTTAPIAGKPPAAGHMTTDTSAVKKVAAEANIHPEQQPAIAVKKEPPKETAALAQPPEPVKPEDVAKIGKEDKESGRTILQPSDNVMQNERLAAHAAPELATKLSHIAASVEGATFDRLRPQKELERVDEKVDNAGKPPETVPDYLASQIAADSPQAKDQLVAAIKKNFNVIQVEDNFLEGKPELANYRSVNLQVSMGNGSTAEIQLVPREQQEIANESHVFYTAGREAGLRGDKAEQEKQYAKAAEMHDAAMEKFKQRNGIEPKPKHDFASTQINIDPRSELGRTHAQAVAAIPKEHVGKEGLEKTPHVTIRYGLKDDSPGLIAKIKEAAAQIQPFEVPIGKTDVFPATEHSSFDHPVIARLETTPELKALRKAVEGAGVFKEDNFPEYKPHVTLGYIKPEFAPQYKGGNQLEGKTVPVTAITVSKRDGSQEAIPLGGQQPHSVPLDELEGLQAPTPKPDQAMGNEAPVVPQESRNTAERPLTQEEMRGEAQAYHDQFENGHPARIPVSELNFHHEPNFKLSDIADHKSFGPWYEDERKAGEHPFVEEEPSYLKKQEVPVIVVKGRDGKNYVWEGNHRVGASVLNGKETINAIVGEPREPQPERRTNTAERKRVEHLTPEERGHELLTSELTGLPNKRAFAEDAATMAESHPHVGYADIDDFKQFNSILGHEGVDEKVLPEIGEVFRRAVEKEPGGSVKVYHRSGDEFLFRSKDEAAISRVVDRVNKELETAVFTAESPDGKIHTKQGAGLKNGTGRNAKEAERNAEFGDHPGSKKSRTAAGLRSGARDIPESVGRESAEGEQAGGREGSHSVPLEELEPSPGSPAREPISTAKSEAPAPGQAGMMPVSGLTFDPKRFQYKLNTDSGGTTNLLKGQRFNEDLAGVVQVWRDPADGKIYVVNGHHRAQLAKETGQQSLLVRHLDVPDAASARAVGAMTNIAEGRGTAVDAAKFMREKSITPADLEKHGISMGEATAESGLALSKLDSYLFDKVVAGELSQGRGIAIGKATDNPATQEAVFKLIEKAEKRGRRVTDGMVVELARFASRAKETTTTETGLFGNSYRTENNALDKAEVSDYIRSQIKSERRLFGSVATEEKAAGLAKTGNVIKPEENQKIARAATQAGELYDKLSASRGPIDDILENAAQRISRRENLSAVKSDAYQKVRAELGKVIASTERGGTEGSEGAPGPGRGDEENPAFSLDKDDKPLHNLSKDELRDWAVAAGRRLKIEAMGDQGGLFGGAEKMYRLSTSKQNSVAITQSQLDALTQDVPRIGRMLGMEQPKREGVWTEYTPPEAGNLFSAGTAPVLTISRPARELINSVGGFSERFSGANLSVQTARTIAARLAGDMEPRDEIRPGQKADAVKLADALRQAASDASNSGVTLLLEGSPEHAAHEESFHSAQRSLGEGDIRDHLPEEAVNRLLEHPAAKAMGAELKAMGYDDNLHPSYKIAEIAAKIATGQAENTSDAADWFVKYVDELHQQHGEANVASAFSNLYDGARELYERAKAAKTGTIERPASGSKAGLQSATESLPEHATGPPQESGGIRTQENPGGKAYQNKLDQPPLFSLDPKKAITALYKQDIAPALKGAAGGLKEVVTKGLRVVAPRAGVPSHLLDTIMRMKGQREEEMFRFQRTTEGMKKMFDKLPEEARLSFIDRMMHGQRQPSTELEDVADSIRTIQDRFRDQEKVFKPDLTDKENYFHLKWTKLPQGVDEDGNLVEGTGGERPNTGQGNRPLQGGRSFMKRKTLPDASAGIDRGGELLTTNPIGLLEHRVQESLKFTTARKMWEELKDTPYTVSARGRPMHMVQFFREGQGQQARALGYEQLNDRIAKVLFPAGSGEGMVHPGEYWVEQNAARLLNNFLSEDLIRKYAIGRGFVGLKNATTAWRLAFSPFHALVESIITTGSEVGRGIEHSFNQGVRQGSPTEAASGIGIAAKAPVAPFTAAREGGSAIRYVASPREFLATTRGQNFIRRYPEAAELVSDLFTGGAKLAMHEDFRMKMMESMRQAMADNNYIGAALRTPGALSQAIQYPLFEVYIPRLKLGMFLREYSEALADREPEIEAGKLTRAKLARETWDNIDYRFGEVNWDNFFFNRTFKTSLQLAFRAFAWRFGNFAFTGSGVTGQARQVAESLKFLKDAATGGESARPGTNAIPKIDPRMAKLLGLAIFGLIAHGMLQWALTRERPKDAKDLIAPRDGTLDNHGHPNRWTLPIVPYRDLESAKANPMGYLRGGTADIWTAIPEAINNRDFRNHLISHPSDPYWEQMFDKAAHVVGVPIGVDRYRQEKKRGEGTGNALLGEAGLSRATNYELTPAEKKMREIQIAHYGPETDEDLEAREKKDERIAAGRLTPKEMQDKVRISMKNNFERGMKAFTYEQAKQVYDVASPEEKALMGMMLLRKRFNSRRTAAGGE